MPGGDAGGSGDDGDPPTTAPRADKTIVACQVAPTQLSDRTVDVTFTNQDGDTE